MHGLVGQLWYWTICHFRVTDRGGYRRNGVTCDIYTSLLLLYWYLVLGFGFNYRAQSESITELYWLISGNALYYAVAIILAFTLKDNRAFCKYVCPITVFLKATSRFSLLKISGGADICNDCGACEKVCPMDIRITDYIRNGRRVLSTECIFCLECQNVCVPGALEVSWGFDCGFRVLLHSRKTSKEIIQEKYDSSKK